MTFEEFRNEIKDESAVKTESSEHELLYASKLRHEARHYNFDNGYDQLYSILANPYCDKSTALQLYWMNRPLYFLDNPEANDIIHVEGLKFKQFLEEKLKANVFPIVLKFNPIDFAVRVMGSLEEFKSKENHLKQIPIECYRTLNKDSDIYTLFKTVPKDTSLLGVRRLYLFEFEEFEKLKSLDGIENVQEVIISTNPYNKKKPKARKFDELVIFKNIQKLDLSYYSKFTNIKVLKEFNNLESLKVNIESSEIEDLVTLDRLKSLTFINSTAESISDLAKMINLENLELMSCAKLINLEGIQELKKLSELNISLSKKLRDLSPIKNMNIKRLIMKEVEISSKKLEVLKDMPLETIQLDCKKITNLNFLARGGKIANTLRNIYLYRIDSSPVLKNSISQYNLSTYNVSEVEMNNSL